MAVAEETASAGAHPTWTRCWSLSLSSRTRTPARRRTPPRDYIRRSVCPPASSTPRRQPTPPTFCTPDQVRSPARHVSAARARHGERRDPNIERLLLSNKKKPINEREDIFDSDMD